MGSEASLRVVRLVAPAYLEDFTGGGSIVLLERFIGPVRPAFPSVEGAGQPATFIFSAIIFVMQSLAIRNLNFTKLWVAQNLSQIAQHLLNFALVIRVFELAAGTRFANLSVSLLVLSFGVPSIFFASIAGVYVDKWDRKRVLVVTNLLRAILVLGYLYIEANLSLVLILSFVIATITQFFIPAEAASIPAVVPKRLLVSANSFFVFTLYASFIVGYSLSAPVIKVAGSPGPYLITSLMFLLAAISCLGLPKMAAGSGVIIRAKQTFDVIKAEIRRNWRTILSNHNLYLPIFNLTLTQSVLGVILVLAPALALAVLKMPLQDVSHILIIPAGVGMLAGALTVGYLAKRWRKIGLISVGLVVAGVALTLLGLTGQLHRQVGGEELASPGMIAAVVALLVLLLGFLNAVISVAAQTLLQENSTTETRGKIFGALNMMVNIAATLPILLAGVLADLLSVTKVIVAVGILVLGYSVWQTIRGQQVLQDRAKASIAEPTIE